MAGCQEGYVKDERWPMEMGRETGLDAWQYAFENQDKFP